MPGPFYIDSNAPAKIRTPRHKVQAGDDSSDVSIHDTCHDCCRECEISRLILGRIEQNLFSCLSSHSCFDSIAFLASFSTTDPFIRAHRKGTVGKIFTHCLSDFSNCLFVCVTKCVQAYQTAAISSDDLHGKVWLVSRIQFLDSNFRNMETA
jgi:hypothetical protein